MLCDNISRAADGRLLFAGQDVNALADRWGTPLYLMDEDRIRQNCRMYLSAFRESFAGKSGTVAPADVDYKSGATVSADAICHGASVASAYVASLG